MASDESERGTVTSARCTGTVGGKFDVECVVVSATHDFVSAKLVPDVELEGGFPSSACFVDVIVVKPIEFDQPFANGF